MGHADTAKKGALRTPNQGEQEGGERGEMQGKRADRRSDLATGDGEVRQGIRDLQKVRQHSRHANARTMDAR